jgi:hypothetical protein
MPQPVVLSYNDARDGQATDRAAYLYLAGLPPPRHAGAQLVGIVYDQPDEQAAIKRAIEEFKVPANQRDRLIARQRD